MTERKFTDEEFIKVLEYCKEQGITSDCEKCPVKHDCRRELISIALDLITRQKAEIEKKSNKLREILPIVAELKAEAIKEFAEEFEKRCLASGIYPVVTKNILKNLVKEKTEGKE